MIMCVGKCVSVCLCMSEKVCVCVCVYLLYGPELRSEEACDSCHLQSEEGHGPVLPQGDGELYTRGVDPGHMGTHTHDLLYWTQQHDIQTIFNYMFKLMFRCV